MESVTPLSRRAFWFQRGVCLLPAFSIILEIAGSHTASASISKKEWAGLLVGIVASWVLYKAFASLIATGYDTNYLYLYRETGTERIPLGSIYMLKAGGPYWHIYYHDKQAKKRQLEIMLLRTGIFWPSHSTDIHEFIDAIWQHNPELDVRHNWLR